jgi:serine/threonine-protein kinase RsbW
VHLRMTLSLPRHPSTVVCARGVLSVLLTLTGTTDTCREELAVIISEACTNAVEHSAPGSPVDISVIVEDRECTLEIGNRGDATGTDDIRQPPDALRVGGRGLLVMAAFADTVAFAPAPPGHVLLRVTKHLPAGTSSPRR